MNEKVKQTLVELVAESCNYYSEKRKRLILVTLALLDMLSVILCMHPENILLQEKTSAIHVLEKFIAASSTIKTEKIFTEIEDLLK